MTAGSGQLPAYTGFVYSDAWLMGDWRLRIGNCKLQIDRDRAPSAAVVRKARYRRFRTERYAPRRRVDQSAISNFQSPTYNLPFSCARRWARTPAPGRV